MNTLKSLGHTVFLLVFIFIENALILELTIVFKREVSELASPN